MITSRLTQATVLALASMLCANVPAEFILGCNAASQTNVDCATIYGGTYTDEGINFFTDTDYHVGYRYGMSASPDFMGEATSVTHLDEFITTLDALDAGVNASNSGVAGNTMAIQFDAETALSGMVLSGLSASGPRLADGSEGTVQSATARVLAFNADGENVFDQIIEGEYGYTYVDFGDIVPLINTLLISSGGGLPGLTSTNSNVAYLITPLPEPGSVLLILTGLVLVASSRRGRSDIQNMHVA